MSRYDSRTTTFSPEGRLFQVEYALEAINSASSTIGILAKDGVVFAADKMVQSKLLDQTDEKEKIYVIDNHILCAVAGMTADANVLLNQSRLACQRYLFKFDEPQPLENLVVQICDMKQSYTQFGGLRPFGVSLIIGGWDQQQGFLLYHTDPAGNYAGWKATAIGQNSQLAQGILKTDYNPDMSVQECLELAAKVVLKTTDAASRSAEVTEIAVLQLENGKPTHKFLEEAELTALFKKVEEQQQ